MRFIDITPQNLEKLPDQELKNMWQKMSLIWNVENVNKEDMTNRAIFVINEASYRDLELEKTELYTAAEEWREKHKQESEFLRCLEEAVRQPFGSPGGKRFMADRLVRMMPPHKTYVEVFAGGLAVFWKKKPSEKEVINDKDADIIMAYKTIQDLTPEQWESFKKMNWTATIPGFAKTKKSFLTSTGLTRFHDFIYLKQFSDVAEMKSYDDRDEGSSWAGVNNLMRMHERFKNVTIENMDYAEVIKKYDSPDTYFYIDPPYPSAKLSWKWMPKTEEIEAVLKTIKGKFLLSYELTKAFSEFNKFRIKLWHIAHPAQHAAHIFATEQLVSNYPIVKNTAYLAESENTLKAEYGAQNEYSHEYFYKSNNLDYRIVFRKLNTKFAESFDNSLVRSVLVQNIFDKDLEEKLKEAISNPSKVLQETDISLDFDIVESDIVRTDKSGFSIEESSDESGWLVIKLLNKIPYVLSNEAVESSFMPPLGYSALPSDIKNLIPHKYQYWNAESENKALSIRNSLFDAIQLGEVKVSLKLQSVLLSKETFKTKNDAVSWLKKHDKKFGDIDEPENNQYWRARQEDPSLFVPGAYVTQDITTGVKFVLGKLKSDMKEAQHSHSKCMDCDLSPTIEVKWAEGMGHAWFCDEHFKTWKKAHMDDINSIKKVQNGEAAKKFSDNTNPNIKETEIPRFVLQHNWRKKQIESKFGPSLENWDLRIDSCKESILHITLEYNPLKENEISCCIIPCNDKASMTRGSVIERVELNGIPNWIELTDMGCVFYEESDLGMKFNFAGKKLKGEWIAKKESASSDKWILHKEG